MTIEVPKYDFLTSHEVIFIEKTKENPILFEKSKNHILDTFCLPFAPTWTPFGVILGSVWIILGHLGRLLEHLGATFWLSQVTNVIQNAKSTSIKKCCFSLVFTFQITSREFKTSYCGPLCSIRCRTLQQPCTYVHQSYST